MCDTWSAWKEGAFLSDLKSLGLDIVAISETRILGAFILTPIFNNYEIFLSCGLLGLIYQVVVLFLDIKVQAIYLDSDGESVGLDVSSSKGNAFRLVAVIALT